MSPRLGLSDRYPVQDRSFEAPGMHAAVLRAAVSLLSRAALLTMNKSESFRLIRASSYHLKKGSKRINVIVGHTSSTLGSSVHF